MGGKGGVGRGETDLQRFSASFLLYSNFVVVVLVPISLLRDFSFGLFLEVFILAQEACLLKRLELSV